MKFIKRAAACLLTAAMALAFLTGCSGVSGTVKPWNGSASQKAIVIKDKGSYDPMNGPTYGDYRIIKFVREGGSSSEEMTFIGHNTPSPGFESYIGTSAGGYSIDDYKNYGSKIDHTARSRTDWVPYNFPREYQVFSAMASDTKTPACVMTATASYTGKSYYTEAFRLTLTIDTSYTSASYTYVLYFDSADSATPCYVRIDGDGVSNAMYRITQWDTRATLTPSEASLIAYTTYNVT